MIKTAIALALFLLTFSSSAQYRDTNIYNLPYDKVVNIATHNSYNSRPFHIFPNQAYSVKHQLKDGVRALLLDIYLHKERVEMYHSYRILGHTKLITTLKVIKEFLIAHPHEVVTILFECYVPFPYIERDFTKSGLIDYVYTQPLKAKWPTLKEMTSKGKQLVVFSSERDYIPDNWCHFIYDYVTETSWFNNKTGDFNYRPDRGNKENSLFLMNHFLYRWRMVASPFKAKKVNSFDFLFGRCMRLILEKNRIPNFVAVDFYNRGKCIQVKDSLNAFIYRDFKGAGKYK